MSYQNDVEVFMKIGSQPIQKELTLDTDEAKLYMKLITEEYKETLDAFKNNDLIENKFNDLPYIKFNSKSL